MTQPKTKPTFYARYVKRLLDIILAVVALIVLSPLFLLLMLLSKIFIRGKVFFTQYRPGRYGKVFKIYKFRSMTDQVDANGELLPDAQRLTKFGKFLRRFGLDELPQLINIIRGEMSIVGPRPRLVVDMIFYSEKNQHVYDVRPGLTSYSHVTGGRSTDTWDSIFAKDLAYGQKITFWRDLKIVLKTAVVVFSRHDGAIKGATDTKREYQYANYLLHQNLITKEQYELGHARAKQIIVTKGKVQFEPDLQPKNVGNLPVNQ